MTVIHDATDLAAALPPLADGLIPVIAQEAETGEVLMLAWADADALLATLTTGRATYYSRSRQRQWVKGETSGNVQRVVSVSADCDGDAVLYRVRQTGPACHTGTATCFTGRELAAEGGERG